MVWSEYLLAAALVLAAAGGGHEGEGCSVTASVAGLCGVTSGGAVSGDAVNVWAQLAIGQDDDAEASYEGGLGAPTDPDYDPEPGRPWGSSRRA
ncbi:hypothetical protein GCM10025877_03080 [Agromyces mangrovi Wang et al. 2018]|nr:hypothetical protein GCM10025877_03080 [Agromyces mangrovi]